MNWNPDVINCLFELVGSIFTLNHCRVLYKDKRVAGVSVLSILFFTSWGCWNIFWYPYLNQWWSFWGGISILFANLLWIYMILYYRKKNGT
jgi:hypothetical protein